MKFRKLFSLILVLCLLTVLMAGCGSKSASQFTAPVEAPSAYEYAEEDSAAAAGSLYDAKQEGGSNGLPANRKFIVTMNMDAETEDLDALLAGLTTKIASLSGYIEDQNIYNGSTYNSRRYRNAGMTVRIPIAQLDAFTEELASVSNVVSSSRSTQDVTLNYVDTESHIAALKVEQERLMALLEKADNMSDLLEIESRLTEVRYSLEQYSSHLRVLDNQIDYATIYLSITEVREYTPVVEKSRWETICDGFVTSLKDLGNGILDFFSWILIDIPYLVVFALLIWGGVVLTKFLIKRSKARKAKKLAALYHQAQATQKKQEE